MGIEKLSSHAVSNANVVFIVWYYDDLLGVCESIEKALCLIDKSASPYSTSVKYMRDHCTIVEEPLQ